MNILQLLKFIISLIPQKFDLCVTKNTFSKLKINDNAGMNFLSENARVSADSHAYDLWGKSSPLILWEFICLLCNHTLA